MARDRTTRPRHISLAIALICALVFLTPPLLTGSVRAQERPCVPEAQVASMLAGW